MSIASIVTQKLMSGSPDVRKLKSYFDWTMNVKNFAIAQSYSDMGEAQENASSLSIGDFIAVCASEQMAETKAQVYVLSGSGFILVAYYGYTMDKGVISESSGTSSGYPAYIDDILEFDSVSEFPAIGKAGKLYVIKDTGVIYYWNGIQYVKIADIGIMDEINAKVDKVEGKGLSANDYTDSEVLKLEQAYTKANGAFSQIENLLDGLEIPVYKHMITTKGAIHFNGFNGIVDEIRFPSSMANTEIQLVLCHPFYFDNVKRAVIDPTPMIKTAIIDANGAVSVEFRVDRREYYLFATTGDAQTIFSRSQQYHSVTLQLIEAQRLLRQQTADGSSATAEEIAETQALITELTAQKESLSDSQNIYVSQEDILFTCRFTRNTNDFLHLNNALQRVSAVEFASIIGYTLTYVEITDTTADDVFLNTNDAVYMYDGTEYYEMASKPSLVPNHVNGFYRAMYTRNQS